MELAKYKACICEGAAENAIMDILLDADLLVFSRKILMIQIVRERHHRSQFMTGPLRWGSGRLMRVEIIWMVRNWFFPGTGVLTLKL